MPKIWTNSGETVGKGITQLAGAAILAACEDAGLSVAEVDGLAFYSLARAGYGDQMEAGELMGTLGIRELRFSAALTGGGGSAADRRHSERTVVI